MYSKHETARKAANSSKSQGSLPLTSSSGSEDDTGNRPRNLRKNKEYVASYSSCFFLILFLGTADEKGKGAYLCIFPVSKF